MFWIEESEIAEHLRRLRAGSTDWHLPRHDGRFSLAGGAVEVHRREGR